MKKQIIPTLGRIIGKAVIVAAMACPVVFSSCTRFDDLQSSIDKLDQRLTELEQKVSDEVATLTALVNGKVTVASVSSNENGSTTITLSDGSTIVVGADVTGKSLLTVIEENGNSYWAITVNGAEAEPLLVNGKKVSVTVTPAIRINEGKWEISVDGGNTWVATEVESSDIVFYTSYSEDEDYVYLTLADGSVISVAKDKEVTFAVLAGAQYFAEGETKAVKLEMEGVENYTITEKPEGWRASIKGNKLNITAPASASGAETDGSVKVLATFANQSPAIVSVSVHLSDPLYVLSNKGTSVTVTVTPAGDAAWESEGGLYMGATLRSEFNPSDLIKGLNDGSVLDPYAQPIWQTQTTTIEELVGASFDSKAEYVVWAIPEPEFDRQTWSVKPFEVENLSYIVYIPLEISATVSEISYEDAHITTYFKGCDGFYMDVAEKDWFSVDDVVSNLSWTAPYTANYDRMFSQMYDYTMYLSPGTAYVVWMAPYNEDGLPTAEDVITVEFTTKDFVAGSSLAAPTCEVLNCDYTSFSTKITPAAGAYKTYGKAFAKSDLPADDASIIDALKSSWYLSAGDNTFTVSGNGAAGSEFVVCAVSVEQDGKYGTILKQDVTLKSITYNENLVLTLGEPDAACTGELSAKIPFSYTGDAVKIRYHYTSSTWNLDNVPGNLALYSKDSPTIYYNVYEVELSSIENNTIVVSEDLALNTNFNFFALLIDANGGISQVASTTFKPELSLTYVRAEDADYAVGQPTFGTATWTKDSYYGSVSCKIEINLTAECKKAYVMAKDPSYLSGENWKSITDMVITATGYSAASCTESTTLEFDYMNSSTRLYVVWETEGEKYHEYFIYNPNFPEDGSGTSTGEIQPK
ncbi:MAG: PL29 family lyase N-terminal domain-containing protein [Candidatus Cryptobacteroides sp.]